MAHIYIDGIDEYELSERARHIHYRSRLYTIRNAIIFMENGDIKEAGTHGELPAMGGRYADMYRGMAG